jgi:type VI secretion system secreted protein Hcp
MAEHWYLRIDGIEGESSAKGHEKAIDVLAWSWSLNQTGTHASGGGAGSGKVSFQDFDFVARLSTASPLLVLACATGTHHAWAELTGERSGGKTVAFVKYRLSDVLVGRVDHADDEDGVPIEEFSLRYDKFEITYTTQPASGKPGTPVRFGWDLAQNKLL